MTRILVVAECTDGAIADVTREVITAGAAVGDSITLGLAAPNVEAVAAGATIDGVDDVVAVELEDSGFDHECQHAAVHAMMQHVDPQVVLMGNTIRSTSFAAALAEEMNLGFASDVVRLTRADTGELVAARPVYGGKVFAELVFPSDAPTLLLIRANVWPEAGTGTAPARLRPIELNKAAANRIRHLDYVSPETGVDLTRAGIIFSIGRGIGDRANVDAFAAIADKLGALLGASRPLVDAGWLSPPHQVGQTGVSVKPQLYVAFGISGALQHLAGMQSSKKVVAINTDKDAPIFSVADIGAVSDVNEVAAELQALL
jgi:electron transfer flavoprotein alpha subunit